MQRKQRKAKSGKDKWSLKIEDTKKTFHAKTGTIKDISSKDITEVEEIKKR